METKAKVLEEFASTENDAWGCIYCLFTNRKFIKVEEVSIFSQILCKGGSITRHPFTTEQSSGITWS